MKLRWCAGAAMALVLSSAAVTASAAPVTDADRAMARQMLEEAIAIPTEVAIPWPSGPEVVSTPVVQRYSGWPGVRECS